MGEEWLDIMAQGLVVSDMGQQEQQHALLGSDHRGPYWGSFQTSNPSPRVFGG